MNFAFLKPVWISTKARSAVVGLVAAMVLVAAACSSEPFPEVVDVGFDCTDPIDRLIEPPEGYATILDVVALPVLELHQQGQSQEDATGISRRFSKMGLLIRSDTTFTLRVADESRPNALISWSNTGQPGPVEGLAVDGCAGTDPWLVYPGGVWVVDPACVTLSIEADGRVETIELPIGERCS